jgi:hypothetical protein
MPIVRLASYIKTSGDEELTHLHTPGEGWHYIPDGETSEHAILAEVVLFCKLVGADAQAIFDDAGEVGAMDLAAQGMSDLAREITESDFKAIVDDLDDVNYHTLAKYFSRYENYRK